MSTENDKRKSRVATLSVVSNTFLVLLKLVVGVLSGAVSVISEAIHSAVDLLAAVIALLAVRKAAMPPDDEHPYGHGKVENVSGTIEALLIFAAAAWIVFEAVEKMIHPQPLKLAGWGAAVMLTSVVVNTLVSRMLFKVGKETDSVALLADAWHLRTDIYTSAGVMVGLAAVWVGGWLWPSLPLYWVDPLAAIAVSLLIAKAAYDLTIQSGRDLIDARLPDEEEEWILGLVREQRPQVLGVHELRTRKAGSQRFVQFHIVVEPEMSVERSHAITRALSGAIRERFPKTTVTIHVDPCSPGCTPVCIAGCMLTPDEREKAHSLRNHP